ncbi:flagellar biosynthesis protein FlhF [Ammoniphilus oxalaticus]|uniref:Flagellar biosynthesis protein FlhF n=1 Tax=Ammoniphilus oxalaticus TaxID=66863 RepID=A0A419SJK1_9BACL|nr:flagellar biosynthesis protein FlhF [Ammoniphilus oxalaticus]RKD24211.1 flagellar biosynthesis protein FlhF [Ammoniphilus oxalaticus]
MKVKKYVVDSMPAALQKIRVELGDQAVILNTKEIRTGGLFGLFAKRQLEVVAAVRKSTEKPSATVATMPPPAKQRGEGAPLSNTVGKPASQQADSQVMRELKGMKEMLAGVLSANQTGTKAPLPLQPWIQRLKEQEVDGQVIQFFVEQITRQSPSLVEAEVKQTLFTQLQKLIAEGSLEQPRLDPSVNLVSFVGPTGVGKTTTIAKVASEQVLNHNRRVGLVTTDTYRIAAVEQLKTYANILNIPIETVFSPEGLKKAIKNLQDCDLILMDTAGRNYQDQQYIDEISNYLQGAITQENYLVLSLTAKYGDLKQIVDNFQTVPIDKLILTKFDETTTYGALVNLMYHYPYPVAYVTTGQSVPEDISRIAPAKIAKLMLGVEQHDLGPSPAS